MEKVESEQKNKNKATVKQSSINNKNINQCLFVMYHQQYEMK